MPPKSRKISSVGLEGITQSVLEFSTAYRNASSSQHQPSESPHHTPHTPWVDCSFSSEDSDQNSFSSDSTHSRLSSCTSAELGQLDCPTGSFISESNLASISLTSVSRSDSAHTPFINMGDSGAATPLVSPSFAAGNSTFGPQLNAALEMLVKLTDKQAEDKQELLDRQENLEKGFLEAQEKRDAKFREEMLAAQKMLVDALKLDFLDLQRQQAVREEGIRQELVGAQTKREAEAKVVQDKKEADAQLARDEKEANAQRARDRKEGLAKDIQKKRDSARDRKASDLLVLQKHKDGLRDKKEANLAAAQLKKDAQQAKAEAKESQLRSDASVVQEARFATQILASDRISAKVQALTDELLAERLENKTLSKSLSLVSDELKAQAAKLDAQTAESNKRFKDLFQKLDEQKREAKEGEKLLGRLSREVKEQGIREEEKDRRLNDLSREVDEHKSGAEEQRQCFTTLAAMFADVQTWTMSQVGLIRFSAPPVD